MPAVTSARSNHKGLVAPISREHDERTALGDLLKSARQRRGLTLEQIAAETKIPLRHLQALERDNEAVIAGGFYQRAELRAYARAVHLDQNLVVEKLSRALQTAASDDAPARTAMHERTSRKYLVGIGMVGVVVVFGLASPERETTIGDQPRPSPIQPSEQAAPEHEPPPSKQSEPTRQPAPSLAVETTGRANDQAAEAPTAAESGLLITSEPAGARVTIDGIGWGETPVTVRHLPAGAKRIRVTKEGYHSEELVTRVANGRSATLDISLRSER
jgi:cytoskeletal protein RodZ